MPPTDLFDTPMRITTVHGAVIAAAPQGAGVVAMTPQAALATAELLAAAARLALANEASEI